MAGLLSIGGSLLGVVALFTVIWFLASQESRWRPGAYVALLSFLFLFTVVDGFVSFERLIRPHIFSDSYPISHAISLFLFSVPYGAVLLFLAFFLGAIAKEKFEGLTLMSILAFLLLVLGSALLNDQSLPAELVIYGLPVAILGRFCPNHPRFLRFLIVFMVVDVIILTVGGVVVLLPELQIIRSSLLIASVAAAVCYAFSVVPISTRVTSKGYVVRTKLSLILPMMILFITEPILRIDLRPDGEFYHLYSRYNPQVIYPGSTFFFEIGLPFTIGVFTLLLSLLIGENLGRTRHFEGFLSVKNSFWLAFWFAVYFTVYHAVMNVLVEMDGLMMLFVFIITVALGIFVVNSTEKPLYAK